MQKGQGLKLADILVTIVIAIVFGIIYKLWGPMYDLLKISNLQVEQLSYGMWFIAGPVAFLIVRKPGVALLAETAAALFSLVLGSEYSLQALTYGIAQGIGAELVFLAFGYKRFTLPVTLLAALGTTFFSFVLDTYYSYLTDLSTGIIVLQIIMRSIGAILITGFFAFYLVRALEKTGVTSLVRPVSAEDYKSLN